MEATVTTTTPEAGGRLSLRQRVQAARVQAVVENSRRAHEAKVQAVAVQKPLLSRLLETRLGVTPEEITRERLRDMPGCSYTLSSEVDEHEFALHGWELGETVLRLVLRCCYCHRLCWGPEVPDLARFPENPHPVDHTCVEARGPVAAPSGAPLPPNLDYQRTHGRIFAEAQGVCGLLDELTRTETPQIRAELVLALARLAATLEQTSAWVRRRAGAQP